jgi:hypothetical protein
MRQRLTALARSSRDAESIDGVAGLQRSVTGTGSSDRNESHAENRR